MLHLGYLGDVVLNPWMQDLLSVFVFLVNITE